MKMKNTILSNRKLTFILSTLFIIVTACERELSDEAVFATFSKNGDVFIDAFSAGLDYFPFVDAGADPETFSVVSDDVFSGTSAMRFDVPTFGNGFVGATFNTTVNRDLSGFDALTFYAKASKGATINAIGFGINGETNNKYQVTVNNLSVSTNWKQYVIPIPDPSKVIDETGLFWLAEGASFPEDEGGYILWIDEVKFVKLGTVAQPRPDILNGNDVVQQSFNGSKIDLTASGLTQTFNANGTNITVNTTPAYFLFTSSEPSVASVDENGLVTVLNQGTTTITAQVAGVLAKGSLEITSSGDLPESPNPTTPADNVKSIFSDAYPNETESNFSPGFGGSTTQTSLANLNGNNVRIYSNNNFTGILFNNVVDAGSLSHLHVDIYTQESNTSVEFQIRDVGANGEIETNIFTGSPDGDDKDFRFTVSGLTPGSWTSIDIPLDGDLSSQKNNLGAIILAGGPNFILDNIYFYAE